MKGLFLKKFLNLLKICGINEISNMSVSEYIYLGVLFVVGFFSVLKV